MSYVIQAVLFWRPSTITRAMGSTASNRKMAASVAMVMCPIPEQWRWRI